jgi:hypothetical protein
VQSASRSVDQSDPLLPAAPSCLPDGRAVGLQTDRLALIAAPAARARSVRDRRHCVMASLHRRCNVMKQGDVVRELPTGSSARSTLQAALSLVRPSSRTFRPLASAPRLRVLVDLMHFVRLSLALTGACRVHAQTGPAVSLPRSPQPGLFLSAGARLVPPGFGGADKPGRTARATAADGRPVARAASLPRPPLWVPAASPASSRPPQETCCLR